MSSSPPPHTTALSGWGRHPVLECTVLRPESQPALEDRVASESSVLARGAGRSYGDAALNDEGATLLTERLNRMLSFDEETGRLHCEAGVSLREILNVFVPRGWFLPVTPGTSFVTLGGALAFDVHGKNHHCDGAISAFVDGFSLLKADGETVWCSRSSNPDLFYATISGAGLTGVIREVALFLKPIETADVQARRVKASNLDAVLSTFEALEPSYPYAVAWIDCLATGSSLGRGICIFGDHAPADALSSDRRRDPLAFDGTSPLSVPVDFPSRTLNSTTVRAFNALYYGQQRRRDVESIEGLASFFYPLDSIRNWNRIYGSAGFAQYQCVVPTEGGRDALVELLERLSQSGRASFLAVLKRMGPADCGLLSFPMEGYTLSLDIPNRPGLSDFLRGLDAVVTRHGGRVYLAKDSALDPATFRDMYPRFPEWLDVKRRVDPEDRFASALSRRLGMHDLHPSTAPVASFTH